MTTATMRATTILILCCWIHVALSQNEPEFMTMKPQVTAVKGETAVIPCRVRNKGPYKVLWSFERVLLTFELRRIMDDERISVERPYQTEWNLNIRDVKPEDAGTYLCQLNTRPVMSSKVNLLVLNEAPSPILPEKMVTMVGSDVEISCKLPDLNEIGIWSYRADDKSERRAVTENDRFRFRSGQGHNSHVHTLVITDVTVRDAGQYFCRARSGSESQTSLSVAVPPPPPTLEAMAESPNRLMVRWRRPSSPETDVTGYTLYVLNHDTGKEHVFEVPRNDDLSGEESFRVSDLTTGSGYTVQLATKLTMGNKASVGKRSPGVNISTPLFVPDAPGWVKVKRLTDNEAEVMWSPPPPSRTPGMVRGYRVKYTQLASNKKPIKASQRFIEVEQPEGNRWKARLTGLRPKTRYHVRVTGYTRKGDGRSSKTVTYLHKALPPELSLNGRVLSDNSVLLTVTSMGGAGRMTNVKMFYTEAVQPSWKRLDFSPEWKFTVVGGLDPRTSYLFKVKARVGGKIKQCVTHITTPPHDLQTPQNVQVSATTSTSIKVKWNYPIAKDMATRPLGYIVHLEELSEDNSDEKSHRQSVVFNKTDVEVKDLTPGKRYNIQVCPFNGFGDGPRSDGLLFHIAESDHNQHNVNQPQPPRFTHQLPERLVIQPGETVKITCQAEGYPVPDVKWYEGSEPIGVTAQGSNQLHLTNVFNSTELTCRATSLLGEIERSTIVDVIRDTPPQNNQSQPLLLGIRHNNVQTTTLTFEWNILAGDPKSIDRFQIDMTDTSDRVLLSQVVPGQTRSFNVRGLQPGTEYRAVLYALGPAGPQGQNGARLAVVRTSVVTQKTVANVVVSTTQVPVATTPALPTRPKRSLISLKIMDVTPTSAVLDWELLNLDPRQVQLFELKVKSRSNFTLLTETLQPNLNVMDLSLQPGQIYYVQVRAFDRNGGVLAHNITRVVTPIQAAPTPQPGPDTADGSPILRRATLTLSAHAVMGESARLEWTLTGARQADIGQFILKIKDTEGRTLLRQEMTPEARSLTLSNLTPKTQYQVELQAVDNKGTTMVTSTSALTTTQTVEESNDPSSPLSVFTEEVDTNWVKVAWSTPVKLLPELSGVVVKLTDIANVTLLTQQMTPLTRSLTVRNLQPGEQYQALVQLKGARGQLLRSGFLKFDMKPTAGQPGRPEILNEQVINSSAIRLEWRNTPSRSPAPGSTSISGYVVNFATVDANNKPTAGTYQLPVFGSSQMVVIPNLRSGQRYMFQVAARNQYSFGPLSAPVTAQLPR